MFKTHRFLSAALLALTVGLTAPACASQGGFYHHHSDERSSARSAYRNGYSEGMAHGRRDARLRRPYSLLYERGFRDADDGYGWRDGNRREYQNAFRRGYEAGYSAGYDRGERR